MATVTYPHVEISADGVPYLLGTRTKVVEVVLDRLAHHWDAEENQRQHPHLSLGQIHGALTYYYDHQAEVDADIAARMKRVADLRSSSGESPVAAKLKRLEFANLHRGV